jgi:hypothetical protein
MVFHGFTVFVDRVKYEDILCNIETDSSSLVLGFLLTLYEGVIYFCHSASLLCEI